MSAALLAGVLVLAGCAGKPERVPEAASEPVQPTTLGDAGPARVDPAPPAAPVTDERTARAALEQQGMVILFDYDSAQIRPGYVDLIAAHARHAARFPAVTLRLEGHTDERGTREYNIGLGERRAQAVRRALELQGVPQSRISTVSYGEERPAVGGSGESSWAQNRRVEIRYLP